MPRVPLPDAAALVRWGRVLALLAVAVYVSVPLWHSHSHAVDSAALTSAGSTKDGSPTPATKGPVPALPDSEHDDAGCTVCAAAFTPMGSGIEPPALVVLPATGAAVVIVAPDTEPTRGVRPLPPARGPPRG